MKVGDKLYFVYSGSCPSAPKAVTVLTVGRKWGKLSNGYRIDLKTLRADGGHCSSPGRAWNSKEEHDASRAADKLWWMFRTLVHACHADNYFTDKQIIAAAAALGIDLDPKGTQ